jgi:hypothetical protein
VEQGHQSPPRSHPRLTCGHCTSLLNITLSFHTTIAHSRSSRLRFPTPPHFQNSILAKLVFSSELGTSLVRPIV